MTTDKAGWNVLYSALNHRELVSGKRTGGIAWLQRSLLAAASYPYGWGVAARNWRYDRDTQLVTRVEVPVISVGNLTVGGTGKTPFVCYLARLLRARQVRVAILSRGYKSRGGMNDEARELAASLPDVPQVQLADRVRGARIAIDELETECILLDDGFQHRRLGRDLDIVLIDALQPFGFDRLLPRGLLREPLSALRRADVVALSRAKLVDASLREKIAQTVRSWNPNHLWLELDQHAVGLFGPSRTGVDDRLDPSTSLESWRGKRVLAFCGIGNPEGFRLALLSHGLEPIELREYPDHHAYDRADVMELQRWAEQCHPDLIVCTRKDQVKIMLDRLAGIPLRALAIETHVMHGENELMQKLDQIPLCATSRQPL